MSLRKKRKYPSTNTYSGRVNRRFYELRKEKGWTINDVQHRLANIGLYLDATALNRFDAGTRKIKLDYLPYIAKAFECKTVREFLPAE